MSTPSRLVLLALALALAACSSGNVKSLSSYSTLTPPDVAHPVYDPYAAYGQAPAVWQPPVVDRNGTIVKPAEPSSQATRPDYEHAPWATGGGADETAAPAGTF